MAAMRGRTPANNLGRKTAKGEIFVNFVWVKKGYILTQPAQLIKPHTALNGGVLLLEWH